MSCVDEGGGGMRADPGTGTGSLSPGWYIRARGTRPIQDSELRN